jgi:hypothetical protein
MKEPGRKIEQVVVLAGNQAKQNHGMKPYFLLYTSALKNGFLRMARQEELMEKLVHMKDEHRDLDDAINALSQRTDKDMLQIQRLKKRKLALRDEIIKLESTLLPDIIA